MDSTPVAIPRRAWIAALVCSASTFLFVMDSGLLSISFPKLAETFSSADRSTLSWAFSGYSVVMAALMAYAGNLADRVGRKRVYLCGIAVYITGAALTSVAPSVALLIAARVVQGSGAAFFTTSSLALMLLEFPVERRGTALATSGMIGSLAAILTPTLGAAALARWSWRWAFGSVALLAFVAMLLAVRFLVDSRSDSAAGSPEIVSVVTGAVGIALITLAITRAPTWGWTALPTLAAFTAGVVLLPIVISRSRSRPRPLVPPLLMNERRYVTLTYAAIVQQIGFFGYYFSLPLILTGVWKWSVLDAGYAMAGSMAVSALVAPVAGRWADRRGYTRLLMIGCTLVASANVWWLVFFQVRVNVALALAPALIVQGAGSSIVGNFATAAALRAVPGELLASANALHQMARRVGGAFGVALSIALLGEAKNPSVLIGGARRVWVLMIVVHATMAALVIRARGASEPRRNDATVAVAGRRVEVADNERAL
jgi:NTE family protein